MVAGERMVRLQRPWGSGIAAVSLCALLAVACREPPVPQGLEGLPYAQARTELLRQGWRPVYKPLTTPSANAREVWQDYQEVEDCSSNGFCKFIWRHSARRNLAVIGRFDGLSRRRPVGIRVVSLQQPERRAWGG